MSTGYMWNGLNGPGETTLVNDGREEHLESVFDQVAGRCGDAVARNVRLIIGRNLRSGRVRAVLAQTKSATLSDYVWRVAAYYQKPGPYLVDGPCGRALSWQPLFSALQEWAYHWHLRHGATPAEASHQATACARRALLLIAHRPFSYDVAFDTWALALLQQICAQVQPASKS